MFALTNQRDETGLWSNDAWLSSQSLEALEAYHKHVQQSEGLKQAIVGSTTALAERLKEISEEVAGADDLGGHLGDRLRGMCACWLVLRERPEETTRAIVTQSEPPLLKLLDYSRELATALGDLVIAEEVLEAIPLLESNANAASSHAKPWLEFVVRSLLNPDKAVPGHEYLQLSAISILLRTLQGSNIESSLRRVWSAEAPKMSRMLGGEAPEESLPRIAEEILKGYSPSSLAEECLVVEVNELLDVDVADQLERLADSLTRTIIGFGGAPIAGKAQLVSPLASAVVLLSRLGSGRVTVFRTADADRIKTLLASDQAVTSGKSLIVSKGKYRALEVLAYVLIAFLGIVIAWYNPAFGWLALVLSGVGGAVTWRVLGRKD